ncbi:MAG: MFS transporter [Nitrososphaeraceae archaeon]|nr:MFS transporter [Nitrososphaeraceae archaeon]MDW0136732.1 MFS transporter [Nitrososphaeraceae archaeon]MDW0142425.1 MFS transporter [Nitrososphaeraceae archaeon]MDW0143627.1 MFS transporter [Nitrososphaeraceae archaeon]MDW0145549.1 MFS transporter [Nitrososphaeraceae archaeon]
MKQYKLATLSLMLARVVYTINWFNIASIFYLIASDFREDIAMLGIISASFLLGVGLFQVPAGIMAARFGPRKIAIYGIMIASSAALVTGFASDTAQIIVLRFIIGIGMACFFGPSVILVSKYLGKESEGLGIGLLNSAHALGGIVGLFGWVVLAEFVGWRATLILSGGLGISTAIMLGSTLLRDVDEIKKEFKLKVSHVFDTLFNRSLIILGLTLLGFQAGSSMVLTFSVFYFVDNLKINPIDAGLIGSLSLVVGLLSSPFFGRLYDKIGNARKLLFISGILSASSLVGFATDSLYVIIVSIIVTGFFLSAGFVIVYAKAKEINKALPQYQTLAVSFVNGVSLFGVFWVPVLFSSIVSELGYEIAWLLGCLVVILLILPVVRLK